MYIPEKSPNVSFENPQKGIIKALPLEHFHLYLRKFD